MAPPTYFFPKVPKGELVVDNRLASGILAPRRLAETFADVGDVDMECMVDEPQGAGPGGHAGTFLMALPVDGTKPARTGYYPNAQDWSEFTEGDVTYWVGIDRDMPPTPDDLVRKGGVIADGYAVTLGDHAWQIPIVRDLSGGSGLPQDFVVGSGGRVTERVQARYQALWDEFGALVDLFLNPENPDGNAFRLNAVEATGWCLKLLGLHYRIGAAEQNVACPDGTLVNSRNWFPVLAAAVDLQTFWAVYEAAQKKRQDPPDPETKDESPDTEPGPPDDSPTTDPAEPS